MLLYVKVQKEVCLLDLKQVIVAGELKSIEDMAIHTGLSVFMYTLVFMYTSVQTS